MSVITGIARNAGSVQRVSEGAEVAMRMLRDGTIGITDFIALWSLEGLVFTANVGTYTTPITLNGGGLVSTEFDLHVAVPVGVAIIPLELDISFEVYGTTLLLECCMVSGSGSVVGTTNTAVTPVSSNTNAGKTSACTVVRVADAGTALTTNVKEIWRTTEQKVVTLATVTDIREQIPYDKRWSARTSGILHVVGPSQQLGVFASAQAGQGYINLKWAEVPATFVT